jgi:hypothetical protein
VREAATSAGLAHTRDTLIAVGVRLRREGGPGVLARRILPRLGGRDVVDSIRHPGEVEILRTLPRFVLLGLDAPIELRFERSRRRGRLGDGATLDEFRRQEERENSDSASGQRLLETLRLADGVVVNDASLVELASRIDASLSGMGIALDGAGRLRPAPGLRQ